MELFNYLFAKARENGKVAEALSEKLQTEVDKNKIAEAIEGINVGEIVQAAIKKNGFNLSDITNTDTNVSDYIYSNIIGINSLIFANATSIGTAAMQNAISIKSVDMPNATSAGNNAMQNCVSLKSVNMPNIASVGSRVMQNCVSLTSVNIPSATIIDVRSLQNCVCLTRVDMPNVTNIGSNAMENCVSLKALKLGANQVATLANTNALLSTPIANGSGYIYVPDVLVEDYKSATNWSVYADQIRPMSECEV